MFGTVLVGTDGSSTAAAAVSEAVSLASRLGARLLIVSAYEPASSLRLSQERHGLPADAQWTVGPREEVLAVLAAARASAQSKGLSAIETFARRGDPADAIIDVAEEQSCDLIVVGNKGMAGAKRFLLGSVPNKISHHAPCSVLIVRTT